MKLFLISILLCVYCAVLAGREKKLQQFIKRSKISYCMNQCYFTNPDSIAFINKLFKKQLIGAKVTEINSVLNIQELKLKPIKEEGVNYIPFCIEDDCNDRKSMRQYFVKCIINKDLIITSIESRILIIDRKEVISY